MPSTNKAVDELRRAGMEATTIARFAINFSPLSPGTVVICDEVSQLSTREADIVLAAVASCPDGQIWFVGDPQQAQPVGAGGLAHYVTADPANLPIVTAELTVNRRQVDPVERDALVAYRAGDTDTSQALRDRSGWEHSADRGERTRHEMARAVAADIARHGRVNVVALAVTHADCEDIADRLRRILIEQGDISGPSLDGPGWASTRDYRAGDRVVLHAHLRLDDGSRLTNGTTATVTSVGPAGLSIVPDGGRAPIAVPALFVQERGPDGRPGLSHAWCRTIDGVQGGTWAQVHLLGTASLDNYRGYVGQSRSVHPTQTWNTAAVADTDHGGRIVGLDATASEQVAAALGRAKPKTFAAVDDPYRIDRQLRAEISGQRAALGRRPADVSGPLEDAQAALLRREAELAEARSRAAHWADVADSTGGLRGLTPAGRARRIDAQARHDASTYDVKARELEVAEQTARLDRLRAAHAEGEQFDQANAWRPGHIADLEQRLQAHWANTVLSAARTGDPYAYGPVLLRQARRHLLSATADTTTEQSSAPDGRAAPTPSTAQHRALVDVAELDAAIILAREERAAATAATSQACEHADIHQSTRSQTVADYAVTQPSIGPDL